MAKWAGHLHKRIRDAKAKIMTLCWYRLMFKRIGGKSTILAPLYAVQPDFIAIGEQVSIGPSCRMEAHPDQAAAQAGRTILSIGDRVRIGHGVVLTGSHMLVIEDDVLIAGGCHISDNSHSINPDGPRYLDQPLTCSPTLIGKGAWLGQNVCVLPGSTIGERAVIGAGSVVSGVIPPHSIAVGSPARVVKQYNFETKRWERIKQDHSSSQASKHHSSEASAAKVLHSSS